MSTATLGQWFTPRWAAECLVDRHFGWLGAADLVIEPSCGPGSFLHAIPEHVPAVGIEIDAQLAQLAREATGRQIITGDYRTTPLAMRATAIVGNPPFQAELVDGFLRRSFELLEPEGLAGFILPAYLLQTPSAVVRYGARWSLSAELLPRTLFPSLSKPLVFALFRKTEQRVMVGLALYEEAYDVERMPAPVRETLCNEQRRGSVWYHVCDQVLAELGGEAHLDAIYASVEPRRPSTNPHWREKVRQTMQRRFTRIGAARYARAA